MQQTSVYIYSGTCTRLLSNNQDQHFVMNIFEEIRRATILNRPSIKHCRQLLLCRATSKLKSYKLHEKTNITKPHK